MSADTVKEETDRVEDRAPYTRYSPSSSRRGKSPSSNLPDGHVPIKSLYEDDDFMASVTGVTIPSLQLVKQV